MTFLRDHRDKWFNAENYIKVLCDHLRSIVRSRTRTLSLSSLWRSLPRWCAIPILGPAKRCRWGVVKDAFAENGMPVHEVEVLDATIEDELIAEMMREAAGVCDAYDRGSSGTGKAAFRQAEGRAELKITSFGRGAPARSQASGTGAQASQEAIVWRAARSGRWPKEQAQLVAEREASDLHRKLEVRIWRRPQPAKR